jgi:hypothetical protein
MGAFSHLTAAAVIAFSTAVSAQNCSSDPLPIVDLGYARQQASSYNVSRLFFP